jgi:O-methyltransferase involved in polyketide biosynthesis
MAGGTERFTENQSTNLATLYGRAMDARSARPVLGDRTAQDAISRIDYDFDKFGIGRTEAFAIACRGKVFDAMVRDFLAAHEDCTVLHLGAGMDARVFRVDPPPTVRWFDVDFPDVIDLRRQIYPERPETTMIGASVTDPEWVADVPADRPTFVVAEGLTMYLEPEAGRALLRGLADRFPSGEMFFDAYSTFGIRIQKLNSVVRRAKATLRWGIDDPAELADLGLTLISRRTAEAFLPAENMDRLPAATRLLYRATLKLPLVRDMGQLLHYRF